MGSKYRCTCEARVKFETREHHRDAISNSIDEHTFESWTPIPIPHSLQPASPHSHAQAPSMAGSPGRISSRRGSTLGSVLCYQPDCALWHLRVRAKAKKRAANSLSQELRAKEKASTQASKAAWKHASTQASTQAKYGKVKSSMQARKQSDKQASKNPIQQFNQGQTIKCRQIRKQANKKAKS